MPRIPDRWEIYKPFGSKNLGRIFGTRFVAFKVPLKASLCAQLPLNLRFTPELLLASIKNLGLIIDLTNTDRYYHAQSEFISRGVKYEKIFCEGKVVPSTKVVQRFFRIIDNYIARFPENDNLIGVHCTHGINRTGYLVCSYMIQRLGFDPSTAILEFNKARECPMERENYIKALHQNYKMDQTRNRDQEQSQSPRLLSWRQENRSSRLADSDGRRHDTNIDDRNQNRNQIILKDGRDFSGRYYGHPPPAIIHPHNNHHSRLETIPPPIDSNWRSPRQLPHNRYSPHPVPASSHHNRNIPNSVSASSPHNRNGPYPVSASSPHNRNSPYPVSASSRHNRTSPYQVFTTSHHNRFGSYEEHGPLPRRGQNSDNKNYIDNERERHRQKYTFRKK